MIRNKTLFWSSFLILLAIPTLLSLHYYHELTQLKKYAKFIIINKDTRQLTLYDYQGVSLEAFEVGIGQNPGNKLEKSDNRTPEGVFPIISIEESSGWEYDFKGDDLGPVKGAYGPWFLRLNVSGKELFPDLLNTRDFTGTDEFKGIGIHGTHDNSSIGKNSTRGCIRMHNADLEIIKEHVFPGMLVVILPLADDIAEKQEDYLGKE